MSQKKKKSGYDRAKSTAKIATIAMAVGAAIGATIGMMSSPKKGKDMQSDLEKDAQVLWKKLKKSKKQIHSEIEKAFGEISPDAIRVYTKAKSEILARVMKHKDKLTKAKYNEIVDSVLKNVTKSKKMQPALKKLSKHLKALYKEIDKHL